MATVDTVTPILVADYRNEIGPKVWHWDQIYFGSDLTDYDNQSILRRYVPVVGDIVMHPNNGDWIVSAISENYIPTLVPRNQVRSDFDVADQIVVPSSSYARRSDVINVDHTTTPIRFYINSRIFIHGNEASHYKLFLGTKIGDRGNSIGAVYNSAGNIISDNIELELAMFDNDVTNTSVKAPSTGYLRELPPHGDVVTLVAYANDGRIHDIQTLIVSHENFIASNAAVRYISSIALDSPYISDEDSSVIEIPRNMNINALALFGIARYNDSGSQLRLPVNGTKFSLFGAEAYTASVDLSSVNVVLSYALANDEAAANTTGQTSRAITRSYRIRTLPSDAAYSVKLFVAPVWNAGSARWDLRYYLYDMRRDLRQDVTSLIEQNSSFKYNPNLYNQRQTVKVAINLMNVGPQYTYYRPVQSFYITLLKPGEQVNQPAYYLLSYSSDVTIGQDLVAQRRVVNGSKSLDLSCGKGSVEEYLADIYSELEILHTTDVAAPPTPTKFRLRLYGSTAYSVHPIEKLIEGVNGLAGTWNQGQNAIVEFFAESAGQPLELGSISYPINVLS